MGLLEILNTSDGDVKITFDTNNTAEAIRARRIITDMLRRGYALLVEVERDGQKAYERARGFDETKGEWIIADFDPLASKPEEPEPEEDSASEEAVTPEVPGRIKELCECGMKKRHRGSCRGKRKGPYSGRRIPMESATATAVSPRKGG